MNPNPSTRIHALLAEIDAEHQAKVKAGRAALSTDSLWMRVEAIVRYLDEQHAKEAGGEETGK